LLPFARTLRVYRPESQLSRGAEASGWELVLDGARVVFVLSPELYRGFSGDGGVRRDLAQADDEVVDAMPEHLQGEPEIEPTAVAEKLSCPRGALTLEDDPHDADVVLRGSARGLAAGSDVVAASVSFRGRRVCFSVRFRGRPLRGSERIDLRLLSTPSNPSQRREAIFLVDHDFPTADGLHGWPPPARVGVKGNTLSVSFALPSSFPVGGGKVAQLGVTISTTVGLPTGTSYPADRAEAGRTPEKAAAAAANAARASQQNRLAASWAPARVRFGGGRVRCRGKAVSATDRASDVTFQSAQATTGSRALLKAVTDIRSAAVAVSGRHVCFAVSFARQPFGRRQRRFGLELGPVVADEAVRQAIAHGERGVLRAGAAPAPGRTRLGMARLNRYRRCRRPSSGTAGWPASDPRTRTGIL